MGRISSGVGLVSGINSRDIIDQLMALEARPKNLLNSRIQQVNQQKLAYTDLSTRLTTIKLSATTLKKISTFQQATAKSSNEDALTATASSGAAQGSFQFQVARLVTAQQSVSAGLPDASTKVGTGPLTLAPGDGALASATTLARLNGGAGARVGSFKITNRAGASATIDISSAGSLDDVITKINAANISVNAQLTNQGLTLIDNTNGAGNLIVEELAAGFAATDLGILTAPGGIAASTLVGSDISYLGGANYLSSLNDGLGIRSVTGNDFRITFADASYVDVDLGSSLTVDQLLTAINTAGAGKVSAAINPASDSIQLTDLTAGGTLAVSALNGSNAATDLGILQSTSSPLNGKTLLPGLNTVLISSLNGGAGLTLGSMTITNRNGASASIDLSSARTVRDILDAINSAGISVSASLTADKTGIQLADTTTGTGNLIIANNGGSTIATQLGIAGTFDTGYTSVVGANLKRAKLIAGSLTVELGGGEVYSQTLLSQLNGGSGVRLGSFRITDRSGKSAVIDVSGAFTLDDVVRKINTSLDVSVKGAITGDKITLTDVSGQTTSNLIVMDLGGSSTATDLGLVGSSASNTLVGSSINYLGRSTKLANLNDDAGVRTAGGSADFRITAADGSTFDAAVNGFSTVGQVIDAINTATAGKVIASIPAAGKGIRLTDTTVGGSTLSVAALNSSKAAQDLGLTTPAAGNTINGKPLIAAINTVLLASLRGGAGLNLGTVSITNRSGASATIDLAGSTTVQDLIDRINAAGISVTATLKESGNGIQLTDVTDGLGNLVIADVSSTTAAELGIAGTFTNATPTVRGANLQRRWVNEGTLLSTYNGGKGASTGELRITASNGTKANINLSTANAKTLGDIITIINSRGIGVTASINVNGDGLLLTDTAAGASRLKVEDLTGHAAADLNILGSAASTTIDGSFEKTITLSPTDTLQSAIDAINATGFGVAALLVNDGSGSRLSLTARNTGHNGRFLFDAGDTPLQTTTLVEAQDAAVIFGSASAAQPLVITSSTNQLTNVIKGVTIDLHSTSSSPVTLTVAQNIDNVVSELNKFAESFNGLTDKLKEFMKFDSQTMRRGILLGDSTAQQIQQRLYTFLDLAVPAAGIYKTLSSVGFRVGKDAKVELDEDKFHAAYNADPDAVKKLFTLFEKGATGQPNKKGLGFLIEDRINSLIDPVSGTITRQNHSLDGRTEQFQDRIAQLDKLIEIKRTRLEKQFAAMEKVLSNLQSQQQSLIGLTTSFFTQRTTTR